jgi:hypothetical protein
LANLTHRQRGFVVGDRITETVTVPDYRVWLRYVVLAFKLKGLDASPAEKKRQQL